MSTCSAILCTSTACFLNIGQITISLRTCKHEEAIKESATAIDVQIETNKTNVDDLYGEYNFQTVSFCLQCRTKINGQHVK